MCRAVTAGDRLRARGDVAVYVSVRVNHVVVDESPISRRIYWLLWTNKDLDRRTITLSLLSIFCIAFRILVMGGIIEYIETSNLVDRLILASASSRMTNNL